MTGTIALLLWLALSIDAVVAVTRERLTSHMVTSDPQSLLEAVRLLLAEVSELKIQNNRLRKDVDAARDEIGILKGTNAELSHDLQTLQRHAKRLAPSRSTKLRGSPDDIIMDLRDTQYMTRLEALESKMACVSDASNVFEIYFEGCNVHVRDGSGATQGTGQGEQSGRGNLIIGYNEAPDEDEAPEICSNSSASDLVDCRSAGGVWGQGLQSGIHNLVVGAGHSFTQHSGLVTGTHNAITGIGATVIGGHSNLASGDYAVVTGGVENQAAGKTSAVVGGFDNTASGDDSLVAGGSYNAASGSVAAVIGGENNRAEGDTSFIAGGNLNRVLGEYSCSTGSFATTAAGKETGIAGGRGVVAALDETMIAGQIFGMKQL